MLMHIVLPSFVYVRVYMFVDFSINRFEHACTNLILPNVNVFFQPIEQFLQPLIQTTNCDTRRKLKI